MSDDTIRLYDVFNGDHIERDDEVLTLIGPKEFDDNRGALEALKDYLLDVREETNRRSRAAGAEDRDHLLACALTTLATNLPGFDDMGTEAAHSAIGEVMSQWLNKSEVPPPAVDGSIAEQLETWASDLSSIGAFGSLVPNVIAGMREVAKDLRRRETGGECVVDAPAPHHIVGTPRDPQLDRAWGRLPVTVAAGGGACGETIRTVYEGVCGLTALIEWSEGDRVVRHPVLIETFVQLDDLSPVLVGEMLHEDYEPTGTKVFLRFSAIRSVEVS